MNLHQNRIAKKNIKEICKVIKTISKKKDLVIALGKKLFKQIIT